MSDNVTEEFKPNPCYWCGKETELKRSVIDGFWVKCSDEENCWATGPKRETEGGAILAWNSIAARLKPEPKKITMKKWVNIYPRDDGTFYDTGSFSSKDQAIANCASHRIDSVEVEINFTDRRGCE